VVGEREEEKERDANPVTLPLDSSLSLRASNNTRASF
jgi:hypothetical protein